MSQRIFRKIKASAIGTEHGTKPKVTLLYHYLTCGHVVVERTAGVSGAHHHPKGYRCRECEKDKVEVKMMTKYRPHKGSLADSLAETKPARTMGDLRRILAEEDAQLNATLPSIFTRILLRVEPYGWDSRIEWETYVVIAQHVHDGSVGVAGFTDGKPEEEGDK